MSSPRNEPLQLQKVQSQPTLYSPRPEHFRWSPYLFLVPTVGMMTLFSFFPMLYGLWMSLQDIDAIRGTSRFIGLNNYLRLFRDPQFGESLFNTAWYTLTVVPLILIGSIAVGIFLRESRPARLLARVGFYIPFVLSPVVVATAWKWLLNEDLGVTDGFLKWAGLPTVPWLSADFSARVSVVVTTVWNLVGFYMLMVLAGLSQINAELYEAARIEGADAWKRFWHITLPMLKPTILLIVILATVHATQAFETILLLTAGGPGSATRLIVQNMYQSAFNRLQPGYAVAQAVVILPIILFVAWLQMRLFKQEGMI
ncbi:MAG: sugar ABC transporter permease [Verrucomicrobia bacterium]|nr:sugar ABC transporter permease [Verrucomicrobiota bacterium]MBV9671455.1 sugar ABC transporter permease [Verrucomicrobiota bacterium]